MKSLADYKKLELKVAIIYSIIVIGTIFYLFYYLPVVMKVLVMVVYVIFSIWLGNFLRKKKKEAENAELENNN